RGGGAECGASHQEEIVGWAKGAQAPCPPLLRATHGGHARALPTLRTNPPYASNQLPRQRDQAVALLVASDGDAQKILDARLLEMPHQDAALAQACSELCATVTGMAREHKIRRRGQHLEAEIGKTAVQQFAACDDALPRLLKPGVVLD